MPKNPLWTLAQSGATDEQAPSWDQDAGEWTAGTVVRSIEEGSGVSIDDTDPAHPVVSATGGGGGGSGVLLLDDGDTVPSGTAAGTVVFLKPPPDAVYDFTGGALPSGWAKHGTPTETFDGSGMHTSFGAGQGYHLDRTIDLNCSLEMKLTAIGAFSVMFGPAMVTSAGTGVGATWYNSPAGALVISLSAWAYGSSFQNAGGTGTVPSRIRISKAGTIYTTAYSLDDGASWSSESASISDTNTKTRIGLGCAYGSSTATVTEVRYHKGSLNPGRAIGWWDGTTLQPLA